MKGIVSEYTLKNPTGLGEALQILASSADWVPFAGGTDLMVLLEAGKLSSQKKYLNLWSLPELRGIQETAEYMLLGALTTFQQVRQNKTLQSEFPNLCRAASETGALSIQSRGTLGGNIANASPAADSPPSLLTYDAELELISEEGKRWVPYYKFHLDYKKTILQHGEMIARIRLPRQAQDADLRLHFYRKVGTRNAQAISKICIAGFAKIGSQKKIESVRIAIASAAPIPLRLYKTEHILTGKTLTPELLPSISEEAQATLSKEICPIADLRSTAEYRKKVAQNLLDEFLTHLSKNVELDR